MTPLCGAVRTDKRTRIDHTHIKGNKTGETGAYDLAGLFIRLGYAIEAVGAKLARLRSRHSSHSAIERRISTHCRPTQNDPPPATLANQGKAVRQVSKYSGRGNDIFMDASSGSSWPEPHLSFHHAPKPAKPVPYSHSGIQLQLAVELLRPFEGFLQHLTVGLVGLHQRKAAYRRP